jgi:ferredoxin-NADP reductase
MPFQTHTARLQHSIPLTEFTKHLEFTMEGIPRFGFVPGQWLSLKTNHPDGTEITRAYSLASAPAGNNRFALCLNRVQDGFMSNFLCDMKEGAEISCQGPFGDFILRPPIADTIFIATGTGVAPFRSMLNWLFDSSQESAREDKQFYLVFGSRTERDIYYHDQFQRLANDHTNFHYLPTLSRGASSWRGLRGYVQEHVSRIATGRTDMRAYVCGLDKMVKANRELLTSLGWDRKAICYEKYD